MEGGRYDTVGRAADIRSSTFFWVMSETIGHEVDRVSSGETAYERLRATQFPWLITAWRIPKIDRRDRMVPPGAETSGNPKGWIARSTRRNVPSPWDGQCKRQELWQYSQKEPPWHLQPSLS
jgi:hypothetical protein